MLNMASSVILELKTVSQQRGILYCNHVNMGFMITFSNFLLDRPTECNAIIIIICRSFVYRPELFWLCLSSRGKLNFLHAHTHAWS